MSTFKYRAEAVLGAILPFLALSASAQASIVRITSINGDYDVNHSTQVTVHPGDVVTLTADLLDEQNDFASEDAFVEEFTWSANDQASDVCDAASSSDCLADSNFEVNDYGVSFYVPYTIGQALTIYAASAGTPGEDSVILENADYAPTYVPPTVIVTDPTVYPYPAWDYDHALAGQGRWEVINGVRYFVPYAQDENWVPYQNGYWAWTDDVGYTWISYDSWGWVTDHYGVWRHHENYGWLWLPFDDNQYRPHTVTWFYDNDYVGWYPYYNGWTKGYADGYEVGFDDGYWAGYKAGSFYTGTGYRPGWTVIHHADFCGVNIHDVRYTGHERDVFTADYGTHSYGEFPGVQDREKSRAWEEGKIGRAIPGTKFAQLKVGDNRGFGYPTPLHNVPDSYKPGLNQGRFQRPAPVGAIINQKAIVPPTTNNRGLANPPRVVDPKSGTVAIVPVKAKSSGQPNPDNHAYHPAPLPTSKPATPPYKPGSSAPPMKPRPVPTPVAHPAPVVKPVPAPKPAPAPAPKPAPAPAPKPAPAPAPKPAPVPAPKPAPAPAPKPAPAPAPKPAPAPAPKPAPAPAPKPAPAPAPKPAPAPAPKPAPAPAPKPAPAPAPKPAPAPAPKPAPAPAPKPAPAPAPKPAPAPAPKPAPAPAPKPAPAPAPKPAPAPAPKPAPAPAPRPAPAPAPRPAPAPAPRPAPAPAPKPAPAPAPKPAPAPAPRPAPAPAPRPAPAPAPRPAPAPAPRPAPAPAPAPRPAPAPAPRPAPAPAPRPAPAPAPRPAPKPPHGGDTQ